jgi:hypothetical protein
MDAPLAPAAHREELVAAIEENLFALAPRFRLLPGAECGDGDEGLWSVTAIAFPFFNSIFRTRLADPRVETAIDRALERGRARGVPLLWWTGPQTRPADLGRRLEARGFTRDTEAPGMALELARLPRRPLGPPGLTIEPVADAAALGDWLGAFRAGFGIERDFERPWRDWLTAVGLDRGAPMRHFLARLAGEPVGTATVHLAAGVAGVYNVATVPGARRQGIGAETTRAALATIAGEGAAPWSILHSSRMGLRIYRALGFREYCRLGVYFWMG